MGSFPQQLLAVRALGKTSCFPVCCHNQSRFQSCHQNFPSALCVVASLVCCIMLFDWRCISISAYSRQTSSQVDCCFGQTGDCLLVLLRPCSPDGQCLFYVAMRVLLCLHTAACILQEHHHPALMVSKLKKLLSILPVFLYYPTSFVCEEVLYSKQGSYRVLCRCGNFFPVGGTGDQHALPYLLNCLKDSQLSAAAFDAIYANFMWHPDPEITALMNQACRMIPVKDAAVPLLDRIIQLQPEYYEVCMQFWLLHGKPTLQSHSAPPLSICQLPVPLCH